MKQLYSVLLIAVVFVCSCRSKKEDPKDKGKDRTNGPVIVDVIVAAPQNVADTIEANGTIVATEAAELRPEISGRITYLNIPEGRQIAKGTVIARIYDADLKAQIGKIKVQLDLANQTVQRYKKLLDIGGLNQSDYDIALNQVNSYNADINVLSAQLDKTVIRAPFSGVIGLRQVSAGAFVTPVSVIANIQKVDKLRVDFTVPEENSNIIRKGTYVAVEVDASTKKRQRALIVATEPQVNTATRNLLVRANLEGGGKVNPGAFVKVYINGQTDNQSIMVPGNAIIPEDIRKTIVTVKDNKAAYVSVETGVRQASNVEIISGINPGDTVVVSGVLFTKPNAPVKVRSVKKLEELVQ